MGLINDLDKVKRKEKGRSERDQGIGSRGRKSEGHLEMGIKANNLLIILPALLVSAKLHQESFELGLWGKLWHPTWMYDLGSS